MLDINKLKNSGYFKELHLEKGEVLFNEGEIDNNIYIVLAGELSVKKFTSQDKKESKVLGYLKKDEVFGEASLNDNLPKQVSIVATYTSKLLSIDANKLIGAFSVTHKDEAFKLLKYIIFLTNKRLSESNFLITANYKISQEIKNLNDISLKSIFNIIEHIKDSTGMTDILYYEINPVVNNFMTLKYDTRIKGKMQNKVIEVTNNKLDLLDLKIDNYFNFTQKLSIGNNELGYIVYLKKDIRFNETDRKVLAATSSTFAGLIKQKQLLDEERDKEFMAN